MTGLDIDQSPVNEPLQMARIIELREIHRLIVVYFRRTCAARVTGL